MANKRVRTEKNIEMDEFIEIREKSDILLLGVTGGIASGKTTVANMLKDLGAPIIDYDEISRELVYPGQPALREIVEYFGNQVLLDDGRLDRNKLAAIVFKDIDKRKKLESFIHPRIGKVAVGKIHEIRQKNSHAIIQIVVPLLIEVNLQHQYHKVLLVYIPKAMQVERLIKRDGITREEAAARLKAQLPIDEKVGYADFVIHNDKTLEDTKKQVEDLWEELREIQRQRAK